MATKGEKITCERGHVAGFFREDVDEVAGVGEGQFGIRLDLADMDGGHATCHFCGASATFLHDRRYQVHTARGWIGGPE